MKNEELPKICPKCDTPHNKLGVFCSRSCANSRHFSAEARERKSIAAKAFYKTLTTEEQYAKHEILVAHSRHKSANYVANLLCEDWNFLGMDGKRIRVILEQNGKCNKCGCDEWLGIPITLEYEHIDGNLSLIHI